ncbi:MATE family efflux transporter [candidate division KSB1 bacterium]|nr:MATE family efflux transporter [candidate division KSB1 bacterium]
MRRSAEMGQQPIRKLLIKFSIPAIVGMMVQSLYNIVDRIFIGQGVGPLGIAGVTVGFPLMLIQMAFGMLIGLGANALISIRLGEQRKDEAEKVMGNAVVLFLIIAIVMPVLGLTWMRPLLRLFGASDTIMPHAVDYLQVILLGTVFQTMGFGMNNFIRGEGNPKTAMKTMLIGAGLNLILDPLFIFGLNMGVRGAAIATVLSQMASSMWVLSYFLGRGSLLKLHWHNLRLQKSLVLRIMAVGSPPFTMHLVASVINAILNNQLQRYGGDVAISTMGILYSIAMLILMPIFGLNQGAQPIIGYNYGAKKYDRVRKTLKLAITAASTVVIIGFIVTQFLPMPLMHLFSKDDSILMQMGPRAMRIFFMMMPLIGFQVVSANYFQAVGKPRHAMLLSLSRQVLFLIPAVILLPYLWGLDGVWAATPLADFLSSVLTALFLAYELRHLGEQHKRVSLETAPLVGEP